MIDCYTWPTPNGHKVHIMLEETGTPYNVHAINIGEGDQFKPDFLKISPNNKMPAIVDQDGPDGKPISVFETGAILIYLGRKTCQFLPDEAAEPDAYFDVIQWLMFQMGGIGPMMGQANVFFRAMDEKIQPAIDRYQNESRRLFEVLDTRLQQSQWLAGEFSIADIANWCWLRIHYWSGVSMEGLDALQGFMASMDERPACQRGVEVPFKLELPRDDDAQGLSDQAAQSRKVLNEKPDGPA